MLSKLADLRVALAFCLLSGTACFAAGTSRVQIDVTGEDGKPLACRVHLKTSDNKPVWEDQLPNLIKSASRGPEGDGRAPIYRDHFVCGGKATLELPPGEYSIEIERGPEYKPFQSKITAGASGEQTVAAKLSRIVDMAKEGWWSGETHVHRNLGDVPLLMLAEDLHVAPVITWWNDRNNWDKREAPKETVQQLDGDRIYEVMAGEDERNGGALLFFRVKGPLPLPGSQRQNPEYPSPMKFVEMAREQPEAWVDVEKPFWWDVPTWLASGKVQSIGLANNHMQRSSMLPNEAWGRARDLQRLPNPRGNGFWTQEIYYDILNCGLRIPPSAGSASGVLPNPVGYNRVYVHLPGKLTYADWWEGLRKGQVFVTNGPLLRVTANGELPGHVFSTQDKAGIDIDLKAVLDSNDPITNVDIVVNGEVQRSVPFDEVTRSKSLGKIHFDKSGWFLVRAITDKKNTFRFASTGPYYVEVGDAKKRISRKSAQFFVDWVRERIDRVTNKLEDEKQRAEVNAYHEQALKFWQDLLAKANAE